MMVGQHLRFLVAGSGSIGRRHMRNLRAMGIQQIAACDPDHARLIPMVDELGVVPYLDFDEALAAVEPDAVLVCTPPVMHVPQALAAIGAGAHVFIEKPLSHTLSGVEALIAAVERQQRVAQVGYNLRFHPGLQAVKRLVDEGQLGRILWARLEVGQYLPDWRPWQDYRQSYTARRELGGGIMLDASHEIDYALWLLGEPIDVRCLAGHVSTLEVDVEDCATVLVRFQNGAQADIHMDFVQRNYTRTCKLVGEHGTVEWDFAENLLRTRFAGDETWQSIQHACAPNDTYVSELEHFLLCIQGPERSSSSLQSAQRTLALVLAAQRAAEPNGEVRLG